MRAKVVSSGSARIQLCVERCMKFLPEVSGPTILVRPNFLSLRIEQLLFPRKRRISHLQQHFYDTGQREILACRSIWYYQFCPTIKGVKHAPMGGFCVDEASLA